MTRLTRFIAAAGAVNLADGVVMVVWVWLATLLTRDPVLVALVPLASRLPWFLCSLPAGIVTDRVDRLRLVFTMDALRAGVFAALTVVLALALPLPPAPAQGVGNVAVFAAMLLAALIIGGAEVFRDNAAQTLLPALVADDQIEGANGKLWGVEVVANALIGPALGTALVGVSLLAPFGLTSVIYAVAGAVIAGMGRLPPAPRGADGNWRGELAEGVSYLRAAPLLRVLAAITGIWNMLHQMMMVALVLHVQESLQLSAAVYGLVISGGAVGGVLGSLFGPRLIALWGAQRAAQVMLAVSAPAFLGLIFAPNAWALGAVMVVFEFSGLVWNLIAVSYRQRSIPPALLGRVNSLYRLIATGAQPIGLGLSGVVMAWAEGVLPRATALTVPLWIAAGAAAVLALWGWGQLRRLLVV